MSDNKFVVRDSGQRQDFETGARRDTQDDKPRFELVSPWALERVAWVYTRGAVKYGDHNWQKGMPYSRYISSAFRHIFAWMMGKTDEDHLAMAAWNLFSIMHHEERGPEGLNDVTTLLSNTGEEDVPQEGGNYLRDFVRRHRKAGFKVPLFWRWRLKRAHKKMGAR